MDKKELKILLEKTTDRFLKEYPEQERKDTIAISLHMGAKEIELTLYDYQLKENAEFSDCTVDELSEQLEEKWICLLPFEFDESFKEQLCREISVKYSFPLHKVRESFVWMCNWIPNTVSKSIIYKNTEKCPWILGDYRYGGF